VTENDAKQQAAELTFLISALMRTLYSLETGDLALELPLAQIRACAAITEEPLTITALSSALGISLSAATQLADRLEKAFLVERFVLPDDHRVKLLRMTPHGKQIIDARRARRVERTAKALDVLSAEDRTLVISSIRRLYEAGKSVNSQQAEGPLPDAETELGY
jgi:DNA-binding MarR family transcriptional regulator